MNPISEEDEDESLNLSLSFRSETFNRVKIISEESNFEPYDEHIVSIENSYTPVLKQWLEYKTESSINSSIFPHITSSSIEMFPMIVRGLDLEQTHLKYGNGKDSEDLLSVKLVRKNGLTRGNTFTAVSDTLLNEFRSPKREDLLAEDLESNISNSFSHDSISILLPRSPNGKEIQLKRALQEDELLTLNEKIGLLIGKNIIIDTTEKKGFWEKLGFSNKKKDDEIFYLMLGSMKSTQKLYLNAQAKTEETRNKATNLQDQIINFKLENDTLQDCIAGLRRKVIY